MEAAKPILVTENSNKDVESQEMIDTKSFEVEIDNIKYKFYIAKSKNSKGIIFKILNISMLEYYFLSICEEDIYNLNPFFKLFQNIEEIYTLLLDAINNNNYSFIMKDIFIILVFKFSLLKGKIIDIQFNLKKEKANNQDLIKNLFSKVNKLMEENKLLRNEFREKNQELKDDIDKLKNEITSKNEEITNIKNELNQLKGIFLEKTKKNITENVLYFQDSNIIKEKELKNYLFNWISEKGTLKNINLLYRATRDGDNYTAFYKNCSDMGPTISLIKTKNGRRFGGFSFREWTDKKGILRQEDKDAFLFSLDNKQKYKILKPNLAIGCYSDHSSFLTYGNNADSCGIFLYNNFLIKGGEENLSSKVYDVNSDYCLSGENKFKVEEVEVFRVIFQ